MARERAAIRLSRLDRTKSQPGPGEGCRGSSFVLMSAAGTQTPAQLPKNKCGGVVARARGDRPHPPARVPSRALAANACREAEAQVLPAAAGI